MGAIGGLLGTAGGAGGTGFNTASGTNGQQLQTAYTGTQNALGSQQDLLNAIQQQGGLQNQSNVYGQLQGVVNGQGPNPAQAMLAQSTGQNVANQASLMAGQRGASANPALIARQAAMQGANLQQQAAGQGASMQAQQALNAMGMAGNMANQMAGQQISQANQNVQSQQGEQQILQGANSANNQVQGALAGQQMQGQQGLIGGVLGGVGSALGLAGGGQVPSSPGAGPQSAFGKFMSGFAAADQQAPNSGASALQQGMMSFGKGLGQAFGPSAQTTATNSFNQNLKGEMMSPEVGNMPMAANGGEVKVMVSPGERILKPGEAKMVAKGKASPMEVGGQVPGQAKVKGDSLKNDNVPGTLPAGAVVIPRSVMQSKNPEKGAAAFVRDVLAKKRAK